MNILAGKKILFLIRRSDPMRIDDEENIQYSVCSNVQCSLGGHNENLRSKILFPIRSSDVGGLATRGIFNM